MNKKIICKSFPFALGCVLIMLVSCEKEEEKRSSESKILEFTINSVNGTIKEIEKSEYKTSYTVDFVLPTGTTVSNLELNIKVSPKASIWSAFFHTDIEQDWIVTTYDLTESYFHPSFMVNAEDGTFSTYQINIEIVVPTELSKLIGAWTEEGTGKIWTFTNDGRCDILSEGYHSKSEWVYNNGKFSLSRDPDEEWEIIELTTSSLILKCTEEYEIFIFTFSK